MLLIVLLLELIKSLLGCTTFNKHSLAETECDMEKFGTPDSSEKTIVILGDRWWPQKAKQVQDKISKIFYVIYGKT